MHYMLKVSDCVTTEKLEEILEDMKRYVDLTEQGVPTTEMEQDAEQQEAADRDPLDEQETTAAGNSPERDNDLDVLVDELTTGVPAYNPLEDVPQQMREKRAPPPVDELDGERPAQRPRLDDAASMDMDSVLAMIEDGENMYEVAFDLDNGVYDDFLREPQAFAVAAINRKRVEVSMRTATPELRARLQEAKIWRGAQLACEQGLRGRAQVGDW